MGGHAVHIYKTIYCSLQNNNCQCSQLCHLYLWTIKKTFITQPIYLITLGKGIPVPVFSNATMSLAARSWESSSNSPLYSNGVMSPKGFSGSFINKWAESKPANTLIIKNDVNKRSFLPPWSFLSSFTSLLCYFNVMH